MNQLVLVTCPVCSASLTLENKTLCCPNRHSFDLAKEGYVNLLRKKSTGDTREMMQARRHFFARGSYQPVSDTLNTLVSGHLGQYFAGETQYILDAGCGEGYYLARLQKALEAQGQAALCLGIDISKDAIRMAAKQYHEALFLVADLKETLPIVTKSIHTILNIFAPRNVSEYARVLMPGGLLTIVIPGPLHMQELRQQLGLLSIEENKQAHVTAQFKTDFEPIAEHAIQYPLQLAGDEISQLVMMTPNYWHLSEETRLVMAGMPAMTITTDFVCLLLRRKG